MLFSNMVFQPMRATETGIDPIIRGMMASPVRQPTTITPSVTEGIFGWVCPVRLAVVIII
jgi:hypothetical protein